jgi:hypothetical protein
LKSILFADTREPSVRLAVFHELREDIRLGFFQI